MTAIHHSQLKWIGKVITLQPTKLPRQLIASWTSNPRKPGHPQMSYCQSYGRTLEQVFPTINPVKAKFAKWAPAASNAPVWKTLVKKWWNDQQEILHELCSPTNVCYYHTATTQPQPTAHPQRQHNAHANITPAQCAP